MTTVLVKCPTCFRTVQFKNENFKFSDNEFISMDKLTSEQKLQLIGMEKICPYCADVVKIKGVAQVEILIESFKKENEK